MKHSLSKRVWPGLATLATAFVVTLMLFKPGGETTRPDDSHPAGPYLRQAPSKEEPKRLDNPGAYARYHRAIRTKYGEKVPDYQPNFAMREYDKSMKRSGLSSARTAENERRSQFTSRGPFNVAGRTRAILPLPDDPVNHWLTGAVGGGIWETTDGGENWTLRTPNFPSLSITSLDYCEKYPNVIYAGTGEAVGINTSFSAGVFRSDDGGRSWRQLRRTVNYDEPAVNRVVVDPEDPNVFLYCASVAIERDGRPASSSIYKTTDGGRRVQRVYEAPLEGVSGNLVVEGYVQQIIPDPENFDVLYAAVNNRGVLRSTNRGESWQLFNEGLSEVTGRIELAIAPTDPSHIYASAVSNASGTGSDLYLSTDSAQTWSVVENNAGENQDFLVQGVWDNTVMVNPFDKNDVYFGGVNLWRFQIQDSVPVQQDTVPVFEVGVSEGSILKLENFIGTQAGGLLTVGTLSEDSLIDVEIRFGSSLQQMAHRFTTGEAGFITPDSGYFYEDYITVPFEVWDVTNNRQLMVSFRDQQEDGTFNLLNLDLTDAFEYVFVHNIDYADTPDPQVAQQGSATTGPFAKLQYSVWPTLQPGAVWDPSTLAEQTIAIVQSGTRVSRRQPATLTTVSDAYLQFNQINSYFGNETLIPEAFHPDHHVLIPIDLSPQSEEFRILNGNDGGVFVSNKSSEPGINDGDWSFRSYGYVTGLFYGADKAPGEDRYAGGLQDQGVWISPPSQAADAQTNYDFITTGDGVETLWNAADGDKILTTLQNNTFIRSTDGGQTFTNATAGLEGDGPFISRLSNSNANPGTVFTVTSTGVARSTNFGASWTTVPITDRWGYNGFPSPNVEVSLASPDIVWAGQAMNPEANLQVSTDRGLTYRAVPNYEGETLGVVSGLATHPYEPNTAYALFSFAATPKVLRTTDLGETWTDISGFAGEDSSATGFPDVAVYSLLVRPDRPEVIWVGTEIGIYESRNNGGSWLPVRGFPNVPVWQMKVVDDQLVIATHGRGIYTTDLRGVPPTTILPQLVAAGTAPSGGLVVEVDLENEFDSVTLLINNERVAPLPSSVGQQMYTFDQITSTEADTLPVSVRAYQDGVPLTSSPVEAILFPVAITSSYTNAFDGGSDDFLGDFAIEGLPGFANAAIHSDHPYGEAANFTYVLKQSVIVAEEGATVRYRDIAIVEPSEEGSVYTDVEFYDYVIVEGTKDGLNWTPLDSGYDATFDEAWLNAYLEETTVDSSLFRPQSINLQDTFNAGDTLLIRFRLSSDTFVTGYGWVIDDLAIQAQETPISRQTPPTPTFGTTTEVYPNPTSGPVKFSQEVDRVYVYTLDGRFVRDEKVSHQMDLGDLRAGTYLLKIERQGATITRRILVQN